LVGYPILPLLSEPSLALLKTEANGIGQEKPASIDYVSYLRRLEQVLILALEKLGITACRVEGLTGVWVSGDVLYKSSDTQPGRVLPAKIASIGVKVDAKGVSRHGFALNVNPDMSYWEGIIGCGLEGYPITCLADILHPCPSMDQVMDAVETAFGEVFGFRVIVFVDEYAKNQYTIG
jgi:lipoate-protein ligase B